MENRGSPEVMRFGGILDQEPLVHIVYQVGGSKVDVRYGGGHESGEERGYHHPLEAGGEEFYHHAGVGQFGVRQVGKINQ